MDSSVKNVDIYALLNVSRNSTEHEIKQAFKRKALQTHPDKGGDAEIFKLVSEAYHILLDPTKKREYDDHFEAEEDFNDLWTSNLETLTLGERLSDRYREAIHVYMSEYDNLQFDDNTSSVLRDLQTLFSSAKLSPNEYYNETSQQNNNVDNYEVYLRRMSACDYGVILKNITNDRIKFERKFGKIVVKETFPWKMVATNLPMDPNVQYDGMFTYLLTNNSEKRMNCPVVTVSSDKIFQLQITDLKLPMITNFNSSPNHYIQVNSAQQQLPVGTKIPLYRGSTNSPVHFLLRNISYSVENTPQKTMTEYCVSCKKSFGFFSFRTQHHCRVCQRNFCFDCLKAHIVPHLGFLSAVSVCNNCSGSLIPSKYRQLFLTFVRENIYKGMLNENVATCLVLFEHLNLTSESIYVDILERIMRLPTISPEWLKVTVYCINKCSDKKARIQALHERLSSNPDTYDLAYSLRPFFGSIMDSIPFNFIGTILAHRTEELLAQNLSADQLKTVLTCLLKSKAKLTNSQAQSLHQKFESYLSESRSLEIPMLCSQVLQLKEKDYVAMILKNLQSSNYSICMKLYVLFKNYYEASLSSNNCHALLFIIKCLAFSSPSDALEPLLSKVSMQVLESPSAFVNEQVNIYFYFIKKLMEQMDWIPVQKKLLQQKKYCASVILALLGRKATMSSMESILNICISAIEANNNEYLNFLLSGNALPTDLLEATLFDKQMFTNCLDLCLFHGSYRSILAKAKKLANMKDMIPTSMTYYLTLYENDVTYRDTVIDDIITITSSRTSSSFSSQEMISLLAWKFSSKKSKVYEAENVDTHLKILSYLLGDRSCENASLVQEGARKVLTIKLLSKDARTKLEQLKQKAQNVLIEDAYFKLYEIYNRFAYQEMVRYLMNMDSIKHLAVVQLLSNQLKSCRIDSPDFESSFPTNFRALVCIMEGMVEKYQCNFGRFLQLVQRSVLTYPVDEVLDAVVLLFEFYETRACVFNHVMETLSGLTNIPIVDIPSVAHFKDSLQPTQYLRTIKQFEKAIHNRFSNELVEGAMAYIDLCMGLEDITGVIGSLLAAATFLLKAMEQLESQDSLKYAYFKIVFELSVQAFFSARRCCNPSFFAHVCHSALILIMNSWAICQQIFSKKSSQRRSTNQVPVISKPQQLLLESLCRTIIRNSQFASFGLFSMLYPSLRCIDLVYISVIGRELLVKFLDKVVLDRVHDTLLPQHIGSYYRFEGMWRGWIPCSSKKEFLDCRLDSMNSILEIQELDVHTVECILNWSAIPRDEGWMKPTRHNLIFPTQKTFHSVKSLTIDLNGEISFNLVESSSYQCPLFCMDDIRECFSLGITGAIFTLDQPDHSLLSHPFQEMKYAPGNLTFSNYLATLFHCDYLLKMITTNTEVNSHPPFEMRKGNEGRDGFLNRLPETLRNKLLKLSQKTTRSGLDDEAHRFWIQAGDIRYHKVQQGNSFTYHLEDIDMVVKTHLLKYDANGMLVDDDENDSDDTPEAEFAREFTKHYNEIGQHFPELLRLKELLKMGAMYIFVSSFFANLEEALKNPPDFQSDVRKHLSELKAEVLKLYPCYTSSKVNSIVDDTLRQNNGSRYEVPSYQLRELENQIEKSLRENDTKLINQVVDVIFKSYDLHVHNNTIVSWLTSSYDTSLLNMICQHLRHKSEEPIRNFQQLYDSLGIQRPKQETSFDLNSKGECVLVPAAMCTLDNHRKVYGGVNMTAKLVDTGVGGGTGGRGGGGGGSGGGIGGTRYVEGLNSRGQRWAHCSTNGKTVWEGYKSTNPSKSTQLYWKPSWTSIGHGRVVNNIDHVTHHRNPNFKTGKSINIHLRDGSVVQK